MLAIPRAGILEAVKGCAARGVGAVIIFSAGFAEAGPEGHALQEQIARIARDHGMAVEGPNCLGFINNVDGIALTFSTCLPEPLDGRRGVGIVSQSGAMATVLRAALRPRDIAISHAISTGNEAVNGIEDFLDFLLDQDATKVITMMVDQIRDRGASWPWRHARTQPASRSCCCIPAAAPLPAPPRRPTPAP